MSTAGNSVTCVTNWAIPTLDFEERGDPSVTHNPMPYAGWRYVKHVLFFVRVLGGLRKIKGIRGGVAEAFKLAESQ